MSYQDLQGTINTRYNTALLECEAAEQKIRPSVVRNAKVYRDGNKWCCSLYWPEERNLMEHLVAFGDTPEQACLEFDRIWIEGEARISQLTESEGTDE